MKAWESGCKGFTVYRDGCRSGVLVSESSKKSNDFVQTTAPKRDKQMRCEIHQVTILGESWTVLIGMYKDKPYEIFGGLSKFVHIPKKVKTGYIVKSSKRKNGRGVYELHYGEDADDLTIIKDISDVFENPTNGAFTRTLSLALRHGAPIQYVVEQLQKDESDSDMYSFSKVIARVLKKYISDGTKATDKKCENCGAENSLTYKEGCKTCVSCGHSKCG
jgi:ribonucleoside-diphosphate reductase alpha chain